MSIRGVLTRELEKRRREKALKKDVQGVQGINMPSINLSPAEEAQIKQDQRDTEAFYKRSRFESLLKNSGWGDPMVQAAGAELGISAPIQKPPEIKSTSLKDIAGAAKTFTEMGMKPEDAMLRANQLARVKSQALKTSTPAEPASFARIKPESQKTYDRLLSTGRYEKAPDGYLQSIASSNIPARVDKQGLNQIVTQSNQSGPVTAEQARTMVTPLPERPRTPTPASALQSITQQPSEAKRYKMDKDTGNTTTQSQKMVEFRSNPAKWFTKPRNYGGESPSLRAGRSIFDSQNRNMPKKIIKTKAAKGLMKLFGNKIDTNFWNKYYQAGMF